MPQRRTLLLCSALTVAVVVGSSLICANYVWRTVPIQHVLTEMERSDWRMVCANDDIDYLAEHQRSARRLIRRKTRALLASERPNWTFLGNACRVLQTLGAESCESEIAQVCRRSVAAGYELTLDDGLMALQLLDHYRDDTIELLLSLLADDSPYVRLTVTTTLSIIYDRADSETILARLEEIASNDPDEGVRDLARKVVARKGRSSSPPTSR